MLSKDTFGINEGDFGYGVTTTTNLNRATTAVLPRVHGASGHGGGHRQCAK